MLNYGYDWNDFIHKQQGLPYDPGIEAASGLENVWKIRTVNSVLTYELAVPFGASIVSISQTISKFISIGGKRTVTLDLDTFSKEAKHQGLTEVHDMHSHNYYELMYVCGGDVPITIEDRTHIFRAGDICLLDSKTRHLETYSEGNLIFYFCMTKEFVNRILVSNNIENAITKFISRSLKEKESYKHKSYLYLKPVAFNPQLTKKISATIEQLLREMSSNDVGCEYMTQGLLMRLFSLFSDQNYESTDESVLLKIEPDSQLFDKIAMVVLHRNGNVTRQEVAEYLHYNSDYINRIVKKHVGISFSEYCNAIRLNKAEDLLVTTMRSINKIIDDVGFINKTHFYNLFFQKHAITPAQYRSEKKFNTCLNKILSQKMKSLSDNDL
ncbi:hypothetical protein A8709_10220 [Paenibacillus pectinilyticus]|uniref:HTH araC/xylS-type domain-containing protein n=2 Tax=Paenibacillus pectinilyticus TaxID=512399 RepID=A0A1C1A600_9BACL|nr:hypothetical protein A8709_10220 [Paenibacillus pectinilyticus]